MRRSLITVVLSFMFITSVYSQGMYLSKEYGLSAGFLYGGGSEYNKAGITAAFSLLGFLDFQYTHSTFYDDESNNSFQNEYFVRAYLLKEKPYFFSGAVGYVEQNAETELWRNFPLNLTNKGLALEAGLHLTPSAEQRSHKIITSIFYRYYNPEERIIVPTATIINMRIIRSLMIEVAAAFYFSKVCIVIGPRFGLENNLENRFYGINFTLMGRH